MIPRCPRTVDWYDCDLTVRCRRAEGHAGPHRDGVHWFDDYGLRVPVEGPGERHNKPGAAGRRVPQPPRPDRPIPRSHPRPCPCDYHRRARERTARYQGRRAGVS